MYAKIMGETISRESIRSNIPPCPGSRVPLSLMPAVRLISDSIKSPHVANAAVIRPNPMKLVRVKVSKYCGHKIYMAIVADRQAANPPTRPSHDFFGEIRGNILCRPSKEPTKNAPVSLSHISTNMAKTACGVIARTQLSSARGTAMYSIDASEHANVDSGDCPFEYMAIIIRVHNKIKNMANPQNCSLFTKRKMATDSDIPHNMATMSSNRKKGRRAYFL